MTAATPPGGVPDGAAVLPPDLARLCAVLVEYSVKQLAASNGGAPPMRGLPRLRGILAASTAAASGRGSVMLDPHPRARLLSTGAAAAEMGVSARRVRQLAAAGQIIATRAGRDWLIDETSARDYHRKERA